MIPASSWARAPASAQVRPRFVASILGLDRLSRSLTPVRRGVKIRWALMNPPNAETIRLGSNSGGMRDRGKR